MKKAKLMILMMVVVTVMSLAVNGLAKENPDSTTATQQHGVAQTTCPVMGGKINKKLYVDYKGKRIYVCCQGCINTVKADPEKYIKKLEKEGVTVKRVNSHDSEGTQHNSPNVVDHSQHKH